MLRGGWGLWEDLSLGVSLFLVFGLCWLFCRVVWVGALGLWGRHGWCRRVGALAKTYNLGII